MVTGLNRPAMPFEFEAELQGSPILTKSVQEVQGQVQKVNEFGQPLYKDNVQEDGSFEETTDSEKATDFEERDATHTLTDDDGAETPVTQKVQVPVAFEDLEPIMVDDVVDVTFSFEDNPLAFSHEEVLAAPLQLSAEEELRKDNEALKVRADFLEELIVELAMVIYS